MNVCVFAEVTLFREPLTMHYALALSLPIKMSHYNASTSVHVSGILSCLSPAKAKLIRSVVGVLAKVGGNVTAREGENLCE